MIRGEIVNDLDELRAYKYFAKAKNYPPESKYFNKYKALFIRYSKAQEQLFNILNYRQLYKIMDG